MYIKSKKDPNKILHIIHRLQDIQDGRLDLTGEHEFLQFAACLEPSNKRFRPHIHKSRATITTQTQETWIVISGAIEVELYDEDEKLIVTEVLKMGDALITLYGGHTYKTLNDNTIIYEIKTGPYYGQSKDKRFINDLLHIWE